MSNLDKIKKSNQEKLTKKEPRFGQNKKCVVCKLRLEGHDGVICVQDLYNCKSFIPTDITQIDYDLIENNIAFKV